MSLTTIEKEQLQQLTNESKSFREILEKLNMEYTSGNYRSLRRRLREDNINLTNMNLEFRPRKMRVEQLTEKRFLLQRSNDELFVENGTAYTETVKRRIIKDELIPYNCQICNVGDNWQSKRLTLILDHVNGISNDHRLSNLRFLCPNCNSQTDTFCGRNNLRLKSKCPKCKQPFEGMGSVCKKCHYDQTSFKIEKDVLEKMLSIHKTYKNVGIEMGVCGTTVRKYCNIFGIKKPLV